MMEMCLIELVRDFLANCPLLKDFVIETSNDWHERRRGITSLKIKRIMDLDALCASLPARRKVKERICNELYCKNTVSFVRARR